jgi:four helix bundle protein
MRNFKKYHVWEISHQLVLSVYQATSTYPKEEIFGLTSQFRRAASSIPSNIAEGCGRSSDNDFRLFLYIAIGSASELEYFLILSKDLDYINEQAYKEHLKTIQQVKKMLSALIQKLS